MCARREPCDSWRRIYEQFQDFWLVLHQKTHPRHTSTYYNRMSLKVLWNYPNKEERRLAIRRVWHINILIQIHAFLLTLVFALPESTDNIVDLGQDLLWTIGTFYMLFKWLFFYFCADDIDEVINELDACHCESRSGPIAEIIRSEQRWFFLMESALGLAWHVGIATFCVMASLMPVWTGQKLPFHAVFPFQWHNPDIHPIGHICIYIWQIYFVTYNMACILYTDLFSSHCFAQLAINLKILCIELDNIAKLCNDDEEVFREEFGRLVAFHQRIISIVDRTNDVFYAPLIMQMITAFLMISLSTFEALVARHEPTVAARFVIFMVLSFCHLSYWCLFGDMVTEQSQQVAHSAYDAYVSSPSSKVIQRDIIFLLHRAQQPLYMAASPFPPFNLFSYMAILKQCYSILTVLLESLD